MKIARRITLAAFGVAAWATGAHAQIVFSGADAANASAAFDSFRAALGSNNGAGGGPQPAGRREINWDAVLLDGTDFGGNTTVIDLNNTVGIPVNRFRARGAVFGAVTAVSGDGFSSVNPDTAGNFPAFSPTRTFTSFNTNVLDVSFVLAGTTTPSATRGFGAIFLDTELDGVTSIEYFSAGASLGTFFVPASAASGEAQFLGVLFGAPIVTDVRLTFGNATLFSFDGATVTSGGGEGNGIDQVTADDFIFGEPTGAAPEPGTLALGLLGIGGFAQARRRRAA